MMKIDLGPHERVDQLIKSGRVIIQNEQEFRFSLDAVLLAHFPKHKKQSRVLDLGTGTGVMPLLIADEVGHIDAVEINPVMADLAKRNAAINQLTDKISVFEGDYRQIQEIFPPESFDLVLVNPPYRPVAHGQTNRLSGVARARHEVTATLQDVVKAARYALRFHGRLAMVHLPERLGEILVALHENQLEVKRLQFVQPKPGKEPNMVLLEAMVGAAPGGLKVMTPLVVHQENGSYTDAVLQYYQ